MVSKARLGNVRYCSPARIASPFQRRFRTAERVYNPPWADYWKSQGRKFCDFCKCWIADNKPSIDFHEGGKKHKDNVSKRLKEIHKNSAKQAKQNKKMEDDIKKMESAAMAAYLKDVENNTRDMTADRIIEEKRNRIEMKDTSSARNCVPMIAPETTAGLKRKTQQLPHEIDPCDPTLSRSSRGQCQQPRIQPKAENKAQGKSKGGKGKGKGRKPQEEDRPAKPVRKLWYEARSPEGYTYYWHIETNESVWDPPEEGYMTFSEQEEEAKEQTLQEQLLQQLEEEEAIANADIIEEKRANAEREKWKEMRKLSDSVQRPGNERLDEPTETSKHEEEHRTYRRDYTIEPCEKPHPYGPWQTVRTIETTPVDLQLPQQKLSAPLVTFEKAELPPAQKTFKEKTITRIETGDSDDEREPTGFKKRKIGNKNVRKRLNDD
nr:WW domain-binding protein 4 isoform X1 [Nomia melanderi]